MLFDYNYDSPMNGIYGFPSFPFTEVFRESPITDLIIPDDSTCSVGGTIIGGGSVE